MFLQNTGVSFERKISFIFFQELLSLNHTLQKILKRERQLSSSSCFAKVLFCGDLAPTLLQWLQMRPNLGHLSPPGYIIFISAWFMYLCPPGDASSRLSIQHLFASAIKKGSSTTFRQGTSPRYQ